MPQTRAYRAEKLVAGPQLPDGHASEDIEIVPGMGLVMYWLADNAGDNDNNNDNDRQQDDNRQ
jgi:hypothetical protein